MLGFAHILFSLLSQQTANKENYLKAKSSSRWHSPDILISRYLQLSLQMLPCIESSMPLIAHHMNPQPSYNLQQMYHHHQAHKPKPDQKFAKLRSMVERCSYPPDVVEHIISSSEHVLGYFNDLDCTTISFEENFIQKTFLEIKGKIAVNFKGSNYAVFISMMIPQNFPMQPPNVRIINDNPTTNEVDQHYASHQSLADPNSYIITNLETCKNWRPFQSNLFIVIEDLSEILSRKFPFRKRKQGSSPPFQSHMHQSNQSPYHTANSMGGGYNVHATQNAYNQNAYPGSNAGFIPQNSFSYVPPGGMGNTGNMCKPTGAGNGFANNFGNNFNSGNMCKPTGASGFGGSVNNPLPYYHPSQPTNQPAFNQPPGFVGFDAMQQGGFMGGYNPNPGGTPFGSHSSMKVGNSPATTSSPNHTGSTGHIMTPTSAKTTSPSTGQHHPQYMEKVNKAKKQMTDFKKHHDTQTKQISAQIQQLRTQRASYFNKSHNLDIISKVLNDEISDLKIQTKRIQQLLKLSENTDDLDWKRVVHPQDPVSQQLLEEVSSLKAWQQCGDKFEKEFVEDRISLQDFLKIMRRIEEEKFLSKAMLAKGLKYAIQN